MCVAQLYKIAISDRVLYHKNCTSAFLRVESMSPVRMSPV